MVINISKNWKLYEFPSDCTFEQADFDSARGYDADLPCDVRMPLMAAGVLPEPTLGLHSKDQTWIEERSWWFVRDLEPHEFDRTAEICELVLETVDTYGEVYLNGRLLGVCKNVNVPFVCDIKDELWESGNRLAVRVTTGLETVNPDDPSVRRFPRRTAPKSDSFMPERDDPRRAFVRRPQYSSGWDWLPRITSCGLTGRAFLHCRSGAAVRDAYFVTETLSAEKAVLRGFVTAELLDMFRSAEGSLTVTLRYGDEAVARFCRDDLFLKSGYNYFEPVLELPNPRIWWPNGMGDQPVYRAQIDLCAGGITNSLSVPVAVFRSELDLSRAWDSRRDFAFVVNGVRVFCKGANWVPTDALYARTPAETYADLVASAKEAGFNMFRVWGGGIYEPNFFYELCLQNGILIWQDFMFGCIHYPDQDEDFRNECRKEIDYQTKRLRRYANVVLFCGNNEMHLHQSPYSDFKYDITFNHKDTYGFAVANKMGAEIVRANCPHVPYWNSSPYGGKVPNDPDAGDEHYWWPPAAPDGGHPLTEPFSFDTVTAAFVSEYGCMGPLSRESLTEFFEGEEIRRDSPIFRHHTNDCENGMIEMGIVRHYGPEKTRDLDDYLYYGQMMQSVVYSYSLEALRFNPRCNGALFWMYHDAWGENGWSVVDYYLRRKAAFYGVKRAFAPVRAVFRRRGNAVVLKVINDTSTSQTLRARVGYLRYDGTDDRTALWERTVPPFSAAETVFDADPPAGSEGTWFFLPLSGAAEFAYLYPDVFRNLRLPRPRLTVTQRPDGNDTVAEVKTDVFAHGVGFTEDFRADDNFFDLPPGGSKTLRVYGTCGREVTFRFAEPSKIE